MYMYLCCRFRSRLRRACAVDSIIYKFWCWLPSVIQGIPFEPYTQDLWSNVRHTMRMARPGPAGGTVAAKGFLLLHIQFAAIGVLLLSGVMRKLVVNAANLPVQSDMSNSNEPNINEPPPPVERMERLSIPKDQTLLVRLPSNTLLKYNSYKDVSILHFRVPDDTRTAMFSFKASEESKSAFCMY